MDNNRDYIPGVWEEEINVTDFLVLNKKEWKGESIEPSHQLEIEENYDVLVDEKRKFTYLSPFIKECQMEYNKKRSLYLDEESYTKYIETSDRKKFLESELIVPASKKERWAFIQPELCTIPLYGTRFLVRSLKQFLKELDKQFQTQEWTHRKISMYRSVEAMHEFEEFALKHGVNVRKPCNSAKEGVKVIWITALFSVLENPDVSFSFYSIITFIDILIEKDIKLKKIDEVEAQRMVDELYVKLANLKKISTGVGDFDYSFTIASSQISKTTFRFVNSALKYKKNKIPFQLMFNSTPFPKKLINNFVLLFKENHPFAMSQSLRKRDALHLTLTSSHTFFRNYFDISMFFGSFDLKKALLIAINGGKDVENNSNIRQVTKGISNKELDFDTVFLQFEMFLEYYITLYAEYINSYAYYYDLYHDLPFRQSMVYDNPYYLMNIAYHNVSPVVNILSAIYDNQYKVELTNKGYIKDIKPLTTNREEFVGAKINDLIHEETKKLIFYKNGHYNVLFFAESPFFQEEDKFDIHSLSPISFLKTSFSGFQQVEEEKFEEFLENFMDTSYTHIRIHKK